MPQARGQIGADQKVSNPRPEPDLTTIDLLHIIMQEAPGKKSNSEREEGYPRCAQDRSELLGRIEVRCHCGIETTNLSFPFLTLRSSGRTAFLTFEVVERNNRFIDCTRCVSLRPRFPRFRLTIALLPKGERQR